MSSYFQGQGALIDLEEEGAMKFRIVGDLLNSTTQCYIPDHFNLEFNGSLY